MRHIIFLSRYLKLQLSGHYSFQITEIDASKIIIKPLLTVLVLIKSGEGN